ncbi:MAG: PIN domain-containing protein [Paludibacter sp.]|nr:PIN domain-containing protein [Paludibacter sp.]MDD4428876.1 PIN domain-containing protein [Paludibacter sp.]
MRKFVLDTNILLHYVRQSELAQEVERELNLISQNAIPMIASVSIGEMEGFVQRQEWGQAKINRLKKLVEKIAVIDIAAADDQLMNAYATLWNYSKNALPGDKLGKSIGIGQNDVWIAALAHTAKAALVTTDGDFDHLNGKWITVHKF